ncbi:hypothetical protein CHL67_08360 [Prosthecochloris sp. GSB1]|uniref:SDR family NAD(P)-dependent oxidoreductase n=1 Tax=Prosthecochloris sp. GSB1 TaxID=281093 RepID=UPI000B8D02D0|nr:SDR family oxidoreductase [Prosthecochloris sp. GSB1]ASQ90928.1 hypothetical protein CHL67_08360 [Prosthecochloris sp. GSB1]
MTKNVVLIAGATGGIGTACIEEFHNDGWDVVGLSRQSSFSEGRARIYGANYEEQQSLDHAVKSIIHDYGRIDAVVHSVGDIYEPAALIDIEMERWEESFQTCLGTAIGVTKSTYSEICDRSGCYIFISSVASSKVYPGIADYCAMKAALSAFSRCLANELAPHNARSNCLSPAVVNTPLFHKSDYSLEEASAWHKLGRIGEPHEIASFARFLANRSTGSWITGQDYFIDGGMFL